MKSYADWVVLGVLVLVVLGLFCLDCCGQMHPSTCRVACEAGSGHSMGSGTLSDLERNGYPIVVSAAHVFDGRNNDYVAVLMPGRKVKGRITYMDRSADVAFIAVQRESVIGVPVTRIADEMPQEGEIVYTQGYGNSYVGPGASEGLVSSLDVYSVIAGRRTPRLQTTATVRQGDSGGPFRNSKGQLISVISTGDVPDLSHGPRTDVVWTCIRSAGIRRSINIGRGNVIQSAPT